MKSGSERSVAQATPIHDYLTSFQENKYLHAQAIMEAHYLRPYNGSSKKNLKDGKIERPIHGAMHAARVGAYIPVLHGKLKTMFPSVQAGIQRLLSELGLTEPQFISLTQASAWHHDCKRQSEGVDRWDELSGLAGLQFLVGKGIPERIAKIFAYAAICKDDPVQFASFLIAQGVSPEDIEIYQYIRKLIYLADCYDIIRCAEEFNFAEILKAFLDIPDYDPAIHDLQLLELAQHIYALICHQKDMIAQCDIFNSNGDKVAMDVARRYSLNHKVKYEHSDNISALVIQDMRTDDYFARYLTNENPPESAFSSVTPAFAPKLHGTSSTLLVGLGRTELNICSAVKSVREYQVAPEGGELINGGFDTVVDECDTCFGSFDSAHYNLQTIMELYAKRRMQSNESLVERLKELIENSPKGGFSNINILLIYLARAKQRGIDVLNDIFSNRQDAENFIAQLRACAQLYSLLKAFGKTIHPNWEAIDQLEEEDRYNLRKAVDTYLTFEYLSKKVAESQLNIKALLADPTPANLTQVMTLLELPETLEINPVGKRITLKLTRPFIAKEVTYPSNITDRCGGVSYIAVRLSQNVEGCNISYILSEFTSGDCTPDFFEKLDKKLTQVGVASTLEDRANIMETLLRKDAQLMRYTPEEEKMLEHPFPMIISAESEEIFMYSSLERGEWRIGSATGKLKVGQEVKLIATETDEDLAVVRKFLDDKGVAGVHLVQFDALRESERTRTIPTSRDTPSDGFPRFECIAVALGETEPSSDDAPLLKAVRLT